MKKISILAFLTCCLLFTVYSCSKDKDNNGTSNISIRLTDNPYNAQEINVDIREVRVNFSDDDGGWKTLTSYPGIYDLLRFQNGRDTLLATGNCPYGTVKEIRFILGDNNSIKINNTVYPLTIPSGSESGLKIKVQRDIRRPDEVMVIDFDAALSVLQTGNGEYKLKPVIKLK
jgi:type 1 fimbria pilin